MSPFYVVSACIPMTAETDDCVIVEAEDEQAAAIAGITAIEDHIGDDCDPDYTETVFVTEVDLTKQVAFCRTYGAERVPDEFQCCGGSRYSENGHSGHCPTRAEREAA